MSRSLKIILFTVSGFVGLLVLAALALLFFVDANTYKPRLEAAASKALGMEVSIGGKLGIGFFPGLHLTLEDGRIRNRGTDLVSSRQASIGIEILPLLYQKVRIDRIALKQPAISIQRDSDGKFNFQKSEASDKPLPVLDLAKVSFSDGTIVYTDQQSGQGFEAANCSLDLRHLRLPGGARPDLMKRLSFTAQLDCGEIRKNDLTATDLKLTLKGKNGIYELKPVTMQIFGAQGSGSIQGDFSDSVPRYHVLYSLPQFRSEEFLKTLSPQKVAQGPMDFSANLSMQGKTVSELKQTAEGEASLKGENITLDGIDLDRVLSRFESSQNFNLVDVGAFFFAGPIGLAVTKGYNFASIFQGSGGHSEIRTLVSDWKVEHGVAQAQDVAMATNENRIALHGGLDFVNEQFNDVTMATIDAKGCAKVRQKIRGSFQKPVVEKPNILMSLTGPARKLLKKGRDLFPGGECEVFYAGSVAPPE
ncbi:MAG: AsmA family protein [Sulfuricaulis sp.]